MISTGSAYQLWVNGVQETLSSTGGTQGFWFADIANVNRLYLGLIKQYMSDQFTGSLDDIRIYNRALTAAEIVQLYGLGNGLVAHYKMNDCIASSHVVDDNIGGYDGTATFHTLDNSVAGKINGALSFTATNDRIDTATIPSLTNFSISFWAYAANWISPEKNIMRINGTDQLSIVYQTGNGLLVQTYDGSNNSYGYIPVVDGVWNFVTVTDNGSARKFYLNGSYTGDASMSLPIPSYPWRIGAPAWGGYVGYTLDDFRIYNRALTQTEITELYNTTLGTEEDNIGTEKNGIIS